MTVAPRSRGYSDRQRIALAHGLQQFQLLRRILDEDTIFERKKIVFVGLMVAVRGFFLIPIPMRKLTSPLMPSFGQAEM